MNRRSSTVFLVAALVAAMAPASDALAHKIGMFAAYDGEMVAGEVYLSGGGRPAGCVVRVEDGSVEPLEVKTDDKGEFRFKPRTTKDHLLVVDTGDGHRAEFRLSGAEFGGATPEPSAPAPESAASAETPPAVPSDLDQRVARAVAKEVAALRRDLDRQSRQARLRDVIGAIGYIFGLAGVLMMIKARSRSAAQKN